ncbi:MAG: hypothetical protein Kow00102_00720 [Spirochaetota bacterium]
MIVLANLKEDEPSAIIKIFQKNPLSSIKKCNYIIIYIKIIIIITIRQNFEKIINKLSKFYYTIHIVAKI